MQGWAQSNHETADFLFCKKRLCKDRKENEGNDCSLCFDALDVTGAMWKTLPVTERVLNDILTVSDVMLLMFLESGSIVVAYAFIHMLDTMVRQLMENISEDIRYVFQQAGVPANSANNTT